MPTVVAVEKRRSSELLDRVEVLHVNGGCVEAYEPLSSKWELLEEPTPFFNSNVVLASDYFGKLRVAGASSEGEAEGIATKEQGGKGRTLFGTGRGGHGKSRS